MTRQITIFWAEREEQIRRLFDGGSSAGLIAQILTVEAGRKITRNMASSQINKLGLRRAPGALTKPAHARFKPGLVPTPPSLPPEPAPLAKPATPIRNGFLLPHHCKFPHGDPATEEFRFCGGVREPDWPYCKAHNAISYNFPPQRKTA